jgi:hypothetical protein
MLRSHHGLSRNFSGVISEKYRKPNSRDQDLDFVSLHEARVLIAMLQNIAHILHTIQLSNMLVAG